MLVHNFVSSKSESIYLVVSAYSAIAGCGCGECENVVFANVGLILSLSIRFWSFSETLALI